MAQAKEFSRALVLEPGAARPRLVRIIRPTLHPNTALVRILGSVITSGTKAFYLTDSPSRKELQNLYPIVPGIAAIARIVSIAEGATDATGVDLSANQMVLLPPRHRYQGTVTGSSPLGSFHDLGTMESVPDIYYGGMYAVSDGIRSGSHSEFALVRYKNCHLLPERRLTSATSNGGLNYDVHALCIIPTLLLPYSGLKSVGVCRGKTVLVGQATSQVGFAACMLALALGAKVIALGGSSIGGFDALAFRSKIFKEAIGRREAGFVTWTGDMQVDRKNIKEVAAIVNEVNGLIDVFFECFTYETSGVGHVLTGISSLRQGGRVCLTGDAISRAWLPLEVLLLMDMTITFQGEYAPRDVPELLQLIEGREMNLTGHGGWYIKGMFALNQWEEAWGLAASGTGAGELVVLTPWR